VTEPTDPAATRFFMLQLVRLSGALLALAGVLIVSGKLAWLPKLPEAAGYVLIAAGMVDFFVAPLLLARRWKSRP
jgi:hypothetical protein